MQQFASSQMAALRSLFANAGPEMIPGTWLQSGSVTATQLSASVNASIALGVAAHGWGDHALAGYLTSEVDPVFLASVAAGITAAMLSNWNTAYGWGNHASAGYLTTETDPLFIASAAAGITAGQIVNWDTAYGWGDHASAGYLVTPAGVRTIANWTDTGSLTGATVQEVTILVTSDADGLTHRMKVLAIDEGVA